MSAPDWKIVADLMALIEQQSHSQYCGVNRDLLDGGATDCDCWKSEAEQIAAAREGQGERVIPGALKTSAPKHERGGESLPAATTQAWTMIDDANPDSIPKRHGYYLVACEGGKVGDSFFTSEAPFFAPRSNGKYSRQFKISEVGHVVIAWREMPKHPALTPAPTQEPPACPKCFGTGWIRQVGGKLKCECKQEPPAGGVTAEMVDRFLAWPLPGTVCADQCATEAGAPHRTGTNLLTAIEAKAMLEHVLGVTISNEKKGEQHGPSERLVEQTPPLTTSPADVPPEGRGELPECNCADWGMLDHTSDCPQGIFLRSKFAKPRPQLLPFNLSDALAGKPVVTRDGRRVGDFKRNRDPIFSVVGHFEDGTSSAWTPAGEWSVHGPTPSDLFMLPTEGSGA